MLGDLRSKSAPHIVTEVAPQSGALYARNRYSNDYADWVGFFDVDAPQRSTTSFTCDRTEFIGRNGSMRQPAALRREPGCRAASAPRLDPCAAIQVPVALMDGESSEVVFRLGMGRSTDEADKLVRHFRGAEATAKALDAVQQHWRRTLGAVQVRTPDPALDVLANGWLLYQTIACRIWARSGYYQSGGAFGFRDQLQDTMALVHAQPALLRAQLLLCASRQFAEGDVQHWWHPPQGRGVRTRISDDYLWLPLALARYVDATGDIGVLDEVVPFLEGRPVNPHDESYYDLPSTLARVGDLVRALRCARSRHGLRFGAHGLPLMGTGDWNDGMNLVGHARPRRERLARLLPVRGAGPLRRPRARARRRGQSRRRCESDRVALQARLEARRAGTAPGTGAPTSTTARRSARRPAPNARSTRSRRAGRCCRAPRVRSARAPALDALHARLVKPRAAAGRSCSIRRSTSADRTRATSPATCPACARTAASTRTARSGRRWPSPRSASASAPGACST